jgi:hypothetical protein
MLTYKTFTVLVWVPVSARRQVQYFEQGRTPIGLRFCKIDPHIWLSILITQPFFEERSFAGPSLLARSTLLVGALLYLGYGLLELTGNKRRLAFASLLLLLQNLLD